MAPNTLARVTWTRLRRFGYASTGLVGRTMSSGFRRDEIQRRVWRLVAESPRLTLSWSRSPVDTLPPKRSSDGRMGDAKPSAKPGK